MIKKYRRDNSKVEDVLFNGTAKHDLNVYMALEWLCTVIQLIRQIFWLIS